MPDGSTGWTLKLFVERFDSWVDRESPSDDMRLVVLNWIMLRHANPYRGMRRELGFPNLWFGPIPGTRIGPTVVVCSYWIAESARTIACNEICTFREPS